MQTSDTATTTAQYDEIPAGCHGCCERADEHYRDQPAQHYGAQAGHSSCSVTALALEAYRAGYAPEYEDGSWVITVPHGHD